MKKNMRKRLSSLVVALMMCLTIVPAVCAYGPPIDVYIDEGTAITVKAGEAGKLTGYSVSSDQEVFWTSSDDTGISVDRITGAYTPHRAGTYVLTATEADGVGSASITITVTGEAAPNVKGDTASPSATKLMVNGSNVSVDAYMINENNYIKLRDLATMVNTTDKNFNVTWDGTKNAINLQSTTAYVPVGGEMNKGDGKNKTATKTSSAIYVNGAEVALTAYLIDENNYFKLRDVMAAFDIYVGWDEATSTATLDTAKSYTK